MKMKKKKSKKGTNGARRPSRSRRTSAASRSIRKLRASARPISGLVLIAGQAAIVFRKRESDMPDIESTSDASAAAFKPSDIKFDKIAAIPGVQAQARGQDASSRASDIYVDGNLIALKIARGRDYGGNFYYLFDTTADNPKKPLWDTGQAKQTFPVDEASARGCVQYAHQQYRAGVHA